MGNLEIIQAFGGDIQFACQASSGKCHTITMHDDPPPAGDKPLLIIKVDRSTERNLKLPFLPVIVSPDEAVFRADGNDDMSVKSAFAGINMIGQRSAELINGNITVVAGNENGGVMTAVKLHAGFNEMVASAAFGNGTMEFEDIKQAPIFIPVHHDQIGPAGAGGDLDGLEAMPAGRCPKREESRLKPEKRPHNQGETEYVNKQASTDHAAQSSKNAVTSFIDADQW